MIVGDSPMGFSQRRARSERCAFHSNNMASEARGGALSLGVDCRIRRVLVDERTLYEKLKGTSAKVQGVMFAEGFIRGRGNEQEVRLDNSHARGRAESTWASRQQQVKSSWETGALCFTRTVRRKSENDGVEAWTRSWERTIPSRMSRSSKFKS